MQAHLASIPEFPTWEMEQDLLKLLNKIKEIALGIEGVDPPMDTAAKAINKFILINQAPPEEVPPYHETLLSMASNLCGVPGLCHLS